MSPDQVSPDAKQLRPRARARAPFVAGRPAADLRGRVFVPHQRWKYASAPWEVLAVPPKRGGIDPHAVLDSHRLLLEVAAHRYLVRYTPAGWRLLFTGAS